MYGPPQAHRDEAWDHRPSMESLKDDLPAPTPYELQQQRGMYGGNANRGNAHQEYYEDDGARRYEDAYAEGSQAYPNTYDGYHDQAQQQQHYQHQQHQQEQQYHQQQPQGYDYSHQPQYSQDDYPAPQYVHEPEHARARDAGETPTLNQYSEGQGLGWSAGHGDVRRPDGVQGHPGELQPSPPTLSLSCVLLLRWKS